MADAVIEACNLFALSFTLTSNCSGSLIEINPTTLSRFDMTVGTPYTRPCILCTVSGGRVCYQRVERQAMSLRFPPLSSPPGMWPGSPTNSRSSKACFYDCFPRSEPRAHFFDYIVGQLSPLERKSIEPMALRVPGGSVRGLQRFLSEVPWDEEHMRWTYHQLVAAEMGGPMGS